MLTWSLDNYQRVIRQSTESQHAAIRQSLDSHQTVIRQSSDSHQTVIRQSLDSHQSFTIKSSETFCINKIAAYVFQNTCNLARLQSFLGPKNEM